MTAACSSLHTVVIPSLYSRYEFTWPNKAWNPKYPVLVDPVVRSLSMLAMGEDVFQGALASYQSAGPCTRCGEDGHQRFIARSPTNVKGQVRRGNYLLNIDEHSQYYLP